VGAENDWAAVSAGGYHSLALKADGSLWAWGKNDYGQLGAYIATINRTPFQVDTAKDWAAVSAGNRHSLALKKDGTVWAWGYNYYGALGDGTTTLGRRYTPVQVGTAKDWTAVSAGGYHSLALKADGSLWVWGGQWGGKLGDDIQHTPVRVRRLSEHTGWYEEVNDWVEVSAGGNYYNLARKKDGSLWRWATYYYLSQQEVKF
jgi:alpha-tubulin suppressor-like RCC1 family protein